MITLQQLTWDNCFSYGTGNSLNLSENSVTQIIGTNGMGKSSIPLIIEEVLYNKNSKNIKKADIANRYVNDGYNIRLEFTKDSDSYVVSVSRKSSLKVKLEKNGEDISSHTATGTYKTLEEVIGIDFKTFSQLVYQNTNSSLQFLTATDTNRKKFLIELLQLEKYVELFDLFKAASKEVSTKITQLDSQINVMEKWISENNLSDVNILPMLDLEISTEEDEKQLSTLTTEIENISEKNKKISKNNEYKKLLGQINLAEAEKIAVEGIKSFDEHQSELGKQKQILQSSTAEINKLEKLSDVCPTCEQTVDKEFKESLIANSKEAEKNAVEAIKTLERSIEEIKELNRQFTKKQKIEQEWREVYRSIDKSLPSELLSKENLSEQLEDIKKKLQKKRLEIKTIVEENKKRTQHNTRVQVVLEQSNEFSEKVEALSKELEAVSELSSNLEVLKKAFSTNGLIAYKIENLVKELEELTNHYLAELSDGRFTLEFVVTNDKLNVQITDNGTVVDILALSSGELARVNTATLIAIRKLMTSISKSRINVLFLDEVINVLDEMGREKMVEVLLGENLNTYVVSHQWTHPLLQKIEVTKESNISRLEQA